MREGGNARSVPPPRRTGSGRGPRQRTRSVSPPQLPILASSVVSLYFLELTDVFKPVHSGFSCYDRSLSMPYIEPTQEAIPFLMLLSLAFAAPAITVRTGVRGREARKGRAGSQTGYKQTESESRSWPRATESLRDSDGLPWVT